MMDEEIRRRMVVIARRCGVSSMLLAQLAAMEAAGEVVFVDEVPPLEGQRPVRVAQTLMRCAGSYAFAVEAAPAKTDDVPEVWRDRRSNRRSGVAKARRAAARRRR